MKAYVLGLLVTTFIISIKGQDTGKWPKLVLLGDSNTQGGWSENGEWASLLANALQRKSDVMNRGYSGFNATGILSILPGVFAEFDADSTCGLIFSIGTNDANPMNHIPIEIYIKGVNTIVEQMHAQWGPSFLSDRVLFVTPPRVDDDKCARAWSPDCRGFDANVSRFSAEFISIAQANGIDYLDWYTIMHNIDPSQFKKCMVDDGVHYAAPCAELLAENLIPIISKKFTQCMQPRGKLIDEFVVNEQKRRR